MGNTNSPLMECMECMEIANTNIDLHEFSSIASKINLDEIFVTLCMCVCEQYISDIHPKNTTD